MTDWRAARHLVLAAATASALLAGCALPGSTATTSGADRPASSITSALSRALLTTADLPSGFARFASPLPARHLCNGPEPKGQEAVVRVIYRSGTPPKDVMVKFAIILFGSAPQAVSAFEAAARRLASCSPQVLTGGSITYSRVPVPPISNHLTLGIQITARSDHTQMPADLKLPAGYGYLVDDGRAHVEVTLVSGTPDVALLRKLIERQLERLDATALPRS